MLYSTRTYNSGFTLVELLVVISIIGLLSAVLLANFSQGSASGRDAKRQFDLRNLQNAIELYKNRNGRYPAGCTSSTAANGWSGQTGTAFECTLAAERGQYILGLAPEFISVLPVDPKPVSGQQGYAYTVNADGSVYKIIAMNVVESEIVKPNHEFARCAVGSNASGNMPGNSTARLEVGGWCGVNGSNSTPVATCDPATTGFQTSYALWGGFTPQTVGRLSEARYSDITGTCSSTFGMDPLSVRRLDSNGAVIAYPSTAQWLSCVSTITDSTKAIICK